MSTISLTGIDKAISGLGYRNPESLKCRFVRAIRRHYDSEEAIARLRSIDSNQLVRFIWQIDENKNNISAQSKQKNLQSIKTSVNKDLVELFKRGDNPEGIIVGPSNIFVMSPQAKDKLLQSFSSSVKAEDGVNLSKIAEVLNIIREVLSNTRLKPDNPFGDDIDKIKTVIKSLNDEIGVNGEEEKQEEETKRTASAEENGKDPDDGSRGESDGDAGEVVEVLVEDEASEGGLDEAGELSDDEQLEEITEDEVDDLSATEAEGSDDGSIAEGSDGDAGEVVEVLVDDEALESVAEEGFDAIDEIEIESDDTTEPDGDSDDTAQESDGDPFNAMKASDPVAGEFPFDQDEADEFDLDEGSGKEKERILAEKFDGYLGAMDRYYNRYILVPAGEFTIGSKNPEGDERQEDKIFLPDFYIGKYPVTNALFEVFVERTGYKTTAEELGYGTVFQGRFLKIPDTVSGFAKSVWNATCSRKIVKGACWYQPFGPGSTLNKKRNHPVVQVSYRDAAAFAAWTGKRLPSESEWESAARTTKGFLFPWGNEWRGGVCNTEECAISDTTPVDHYREGTNDFGIADTLGNVLEWTVDECDPLYSNKKDIACHIAKGGSWISDKTVRLFSRFRFELKFTSNILGFRCVAD